MGSDPTLSLQLYTYRLSFSVHVYMLYQSWRNWAVSLAFIQKGVLFSTRRSPCEIRPTSFSFRFGLKLGIDPCELKVNSIHLHVKIQFFSRVKTRNKAFFFFLGVHKDSRIPIHTAEARLQVSCVFHSDSPITRSRVLASLCETICTTYCFSGAPKPCSSASKQITYGLVCWRLWMLQCI
jgi:hypothetical protein